MTDKVCIMMSGPCSADQFDDVTVNYAGKYSFEDGEHVVRFEEKMVTDDDPDGICQSVLRLGRQKMSFKRTGAVETYLVLEPGGRHEADYEMPFGTMSFVFETDMYELREFENAISVRARYNLSSGGYSQGVQEVRFEIRPFDRLKK